MKKALCIIGFVLYTFFVYLFASAYGSSTALGEIYKEFPDLRGKRIQRLIDDCNNVIEAIEKPQEKKKVKPIQEDLATAINKLAIQLTKSDLGISCVAGEKTIMIDINTAKMLQKAETAIAMFDLLINSLMADWKGGGHALRVICTNAKGRISFIHNQYQISIIPGYLGKNTYQLRFKPLQDTK